MKLQRRLARLRAAQASAAQADPEPAPGADAEAPRASASLSELRSQLSVLRRRHGREPAPRPARRSIESLGFAPLVGGARVGAWQRQVRLGPGVRVGRQAIGPALDADVRALGVLTGDASLERAAAERFVFFDTETTGLGGAGAYPFLVGVAWAEQATGEWVLEQVLLSEPEAEPQLLAQVAQRLARASAWVSFNGKAFDAPLLQSRWALHGVEPPPPRPHVDLLHVCRRLHATRLRPCSLQSVERYVLGFGRQDDVGGIEVVRHFHTFLTTGCAGHLAPLATHNDLDVRSLIALVGLYARPVGELVESSALTGSDLVALSRWLRSQKRPHGAALAADTALRRGGGAEAQQERAWVYKKAGEREAALAAFAAAAEGATDPISHLELAKLCEHHLKQPEQALGWVARGTPEAPEATQRRRERLERKLTRKQGDSLGDGIVVASPTTPEAQPGRARAVDRLRLPGLPVRGRGGGLP